MAYWIKQLGLPHNRVDENDKCDFSRTIDFPERPSGIKIDDQLFVIAVGHKFLYAQLEVVSKPFEADPQEFATGVRHKDFPWLLYCRNINKGFSDEWFSRKLDLMALAQQYHEETNQPVTTPGAPNLNGLLYGNSYIGLQEGFVQYLLQKMK